MPEFFARIHAAVWMKQSLKAALACVLILLGITPIAHANMVLELDSTHFKVEVIPVSGGGSNAFKARLTFMNTNMNNVGSMVGVIDLRTNVPASQIATQALVSTMETVNFKLSTSEDDPYTTELLFALSSEQGWTSTEITFEWFFSAMPGTTITEAIAMLDGIVAVEIIEGCKTTALSGKPWLKAITQQEPQEISIPYQGMPGDADVLAYPNPTTGILHVDQWSLDLLPDHVRICAPAGQIVWERPADDTALLLDLQGLPPGTYLLYGILGGKVLYTHRIQKM